MNINTGDFKYGKTGWRKVRLGEVCKFQMGQPLKSQNFVRGNVPVIAGGINPAGYHHEANRKGKTITISASGANAGYVNLHKKPIFATDCSTISEDPKYCIEYLYFWLKSKQSDIYRKQTGGAQPHIHPRNLVDLLVPIPDIQVQDEIGNALSILESQITVIKRLISKYESIKKATVNMLFHPKGEWRRVKLGEAFSFGNGYTPSKSVKAYWENGTIPWFRMEDIRANGRILKDSIQHITPDAIKGGSLFPSGSFILSTTATLGEYAFLIADSLANQQFTFLVKNVNRDYEIDNMWFLQYLAVIGEWCKKTANAGGLLAVNMNDLYNYEIPLPSLQEQKRIVGILDFLDDTTNELKSQLAKMQDFKYSMLQYFFGD